MKKMFCSVLIGLSLIGLIGCGADPNKLVSDKQIETIEELIKNEEKLDRRLENQLSYELQELEYEGNKEALKLIERSQELQDKATRLIESKEYSDIYKLSEKDAERLIKISKEINEIKEELIELCEDVE